MSPIKLLWVKYNILFRFQRSNKIICESIGRKKCFVCLAADYGNLGDCAITYAQKEFLKEHLPEYDIIEFPISRTITGLKSLKKIANKDDLITIVGGGNMGSKYFDIELCRLLIVKNFPNNRIICFPQSFIQDIEDVYLSRLSKKIYNNHNHLTLCARENKSFKILNRLYENCDLLLSPDIVFYLNKRNKLHRGNIVTFCLRNDSEALDNNRELKVITDFLSSRNIEKKYHDTHLGYNGLSEQKRHEELEKIWRQFSKSKFVVTDRLHGMIFAYITGTPAIVLANNNFKIAESYQWISDCNFIFMPNNLDRLSENLTQITNIREDLTSHKINNSLFESIIS